MTNKQLSLHLSGIYYLIFYIMKRLLLVIFAFLWVIFWYTFAQTSGTSTITWEMTTSLITGNSGNQYQIAKVEILSIIPADLAINIEGLFKNFEEIKQSSGSSENEERKRILQDIVNVIAWNLAPEWNTIPSNQVDPLDMETIIMPNICKIITSYNMNAEICNGSEYIGSETWSDLYYIVLVGIIITIFCASWLLWYRITRKTGRWQVFLTIIWIIITSLIGFFVYNGDITINFWEISWFIWLIVWLIIWLIIRKYMLAKRIKQKEEQRKKVLDMINSSKEALEKQEYEQALNICNEAIKTYENIWIPNYSEQEFYIKISEYQKSLQKTLSLLNKSLTLDKNDKESFINVWETLFFLWRNEEAIKTYKEAIRLYKDDKNLYYNLSTHLSNAWKHNEALEMLNKTIEIDPKFKDAYFNKWGILMELWKNEESLQIYSKLIDIDKYYTNAYINKWIVLMKLWKHQEALNIYNEALKNKLNNIGIYQNKWVCLSKLNRLEDALDTYEEGIKISPLHKETWVNKWAVLIKLWKYQEALKSLDYIITKIDPLDGHALYGKACIFAIMNRPKESIENLRKAAQIDAKYKEKAQTDEDFRNIRNLSEFKQII